MSCDCEFYKVSFGRADVAHRAVVVNTEEIHALSQRLFRSFFMGGFECSSHRLSSGKRLDLLESTRHQEFVTSDYRRLISENLLAARSGIRWHLVEPVPYRYDFSSFLPMLQAARDLEIQVIWDLFHYGYPDDLNIFQAEFVDRFQGLAKATAKVLAAETDSVQFICPVNEISFFAWAAGDVGYLNPFVRGRSFELKMQLVRAAIAAIEAIWDVLPATRIVHVDPVIHIVAHPKHPHDREVAEGHRTAQFQAWDMLAGRMLPDMGGHEKYLDIIGVNYYRNNQWIHDHGPIERDHSLYRPFRELLREVHSRYKRPILISETGAEDDARPTWLRYVCNEARAAMGQGVQLEGICLYPVLNHPGWDNDRHCHNGLWDYADDNGERELYMPLAEELHRQQRAFATLIDARSAAAPAFETQSMKTH
jgi:beta-glucosidase/6-phospho-beta-glucosidase/beta-galactosidase